MHFFRYLSSLFAGRFLTLCISGVSILSVSTLPVNAEGIEFPGLQELMSEEEFSSAGLDTLTPLQRSALNRWLELHAQFQLEQAEQSKAPETLASTGTQVQAKRRAKTDAREVIQTRIAGAFKGWSGSTLFTLENGQYWKQRQPGRYYYRAESPDVELYKTRLGFWEMKLLATGKTVKVSRYQPRD